MEKGFIGKRVQRFSFRKLSVGLVSASIGSVFLLFSGGQLQSVSAAELENRPTVPLQYKYVSEAELSAAEQELVVKEVPKFVEETSDTYYLVYRPKKSSQGVLPKTGNASVWEAILSVSGLALAVLVIRKRRSGKQYLAAVLLVTSLGSTLMAPTALAISNIQLAAYNQSLNLALGEALPKPLDIQGFDYVGYLRSDKEIGQTKSASNSALPSQSKSLLSPEEQARLESLEAKKPLSDEKPELKINQVNTVKTENVPYETVYQNSDALEEGQTQIAQAGVMGVRTITTRNHYGNDGSQKILLMSELVSDEVTTAPVTQIVLVGTRKAVVPAPEPIPTPTPVPSPDPVPTPTPDSTPTTNSAADAVSEVPAEAPVHEIQEAQVTTQETTRTEAIPYGTESRLTPDLPQGQSQVTQSGQAGERTITVRNHYMDGQLVYTEEIVNQVTRQPVNEVVAQGAASPTHAKTEAAVHDIKAAAIMTEDETRTEEVAYETELRYVNDLAAGQRRIVQAGQAGERTITTRKHLVEGQLLQAEIITDQVTKAPVKEIVEIGSQAERVKPNLTIQSLTKDEEELSVTVQYALDDPSAAFVSAKAQLFEGDQLLKEVAIPNPQRKLTLTDLNPYTEYTLKTVLEYNLGQGVQISQEEAQAKFELERKKIEIKDIDSIELLHKKEDSLSRVLSLASIPTDLSDYLVRIKSDKYKEMLLPVATISEANKDGQSVYKVSLSFDQLVQDSSQGYQADHAFYIGKTAAPETGVYTSFKALLDAMKADMAGNFILGADLTASEVSLESDAASYLPGDFTGSLTGRHNGQNYAIYQLTKPLFANLKNARISHLDLKDVAIEATDDAGALAKGSDNAKITDVAVQGSIIGKSGGSYRQSLAGLIASANNTQIDNASFSGTIQTNQQSGGNFNTGGIVGHQRGHHSYIDKSRVDATIISASRHNNQRVGGIIGQMEAGRLTKSYVTGEIRNSTNSGQVGGVVGSTWSNGSINEVISDLRASTSFAVTGDNYGGARIANAFVTESSPLPKQDSYIAGTLTKEEAASKLQAFGISVSLSDSGQLLTGNQLETDYSKLRRAQADRAVAYSNVEKLLPFYDKHTIVAYGNRVDLNSKLAKTALLDVVPMKDDQIITDVYKNKATINKLLLHYADNTVEYLPISYKGDFKNQQVAEYSIAGTKLIYTPEEFLSDYAAVLEKLLPVLSAVELDSDAVRQTLGLESGASLSPLYLDKAFAQVKEHLAEETVKVLAMDKSINSLGKQVADLMVKKITDNKEAFLLGLTYLNRWYNINYDNINTKDLTAYKFDFFGNNQASALDTIIKLGQSGIGNLRASNNVAAYSSSLSAATGKAGLFQHLESYRQLFLPLKTNNEWLKTNSKAYMVETKSEIAEARKLQDEAKPDSKYSVGIYDKISHPNWEHRNMLLPLLTMLEKGVYAISNMRTLSFGSYERYKDRADAITGDAFYKYVEDRVNQAAVWQRDHFDFWYQVLKPEDRNRLFATVLNYDGFHLKNDKGQNYWASLTDSAPSIQNFFGPVGKHYTGNGSGAYATGNLTHFVIDRILDQYGMSVFTHEMVHNSDGSVYFANNDRREGLGAELYALGFLQATDGNKEAILALNTFYSGNKEAIDRYHTYNPVERYKDASDLQEYVHGMFDVLYTLDYMEGQAVLQQSDEVKGKWFRKIENYYIKDRDGLDTHAGNRIRKFTEEEIKELKSFNDLIDKDVINRRNYWDQADALGRNGYYTISLFSPIYAGLSNPNGSPGDIMFRRMAYEILAAKGYQEGMVPYASGQYTAEALASGSKTWSSWYGRYVGLVTDQLVFDKLFKDEYSSWAGFKKAMFQERVDKLPLLKPVTIQYELGVPNSGKEVTISSAEQLQTMMDQALAQDMKNIDRTTSHAPASWVNLLKQRVYNAYLRSTDDFRESIYK